VTDEPIWLAMTNLPDLTSAQTIAHTLVEAKLAACVNILPAVQSVYRWQGAVEQASEVTLLIKTTQRRYPGLQQAIVAAHPYDMPEVIGWPLAAGHPPYLHWVAAETEIDSHA
jgi:periplasmic divalent cation tolerance protein